MNSTEYMKMAAFEELKQALQTESQLGAIRIPRFVFAMVYFTIQ
jgi:hypothetical protein